MKLYISNETKLHREIAELLKEHPEGVEQIIVSDDGFCFKNWLKKDAQKYKQYTDIILCRSAVTESNKEFAEALNQYQMIYTSKIIIILDVLDYELIRMLLETGISNIIYSDNRDEYPILLRTCMEKGLEPIYWVRKLPEDTGTNKSRAKLTALIILVSLSLLAAVIAAAWILHKSTDETTAATNTNTTSASSHTETVSLQLTATTVTASACSTLSDLQTTTTETTTTTTQSTFPAAATTTPEQATTTTAATTKATEKKTSTTTKKVTTTTKKVTTTAKPKPVTTTKKVTTTAKATTTTKKTTTTTKAATTLTPIRLRGLALKTVSADNTVYIKVGESTQVTPVFTPAQATNKKVYWSSNREDRAVVDSSGKVTGRSPGAVIIKCVSDDGGLSAACMIVVKE